MKTFNEWKISGNDSNPTYSKGEHGGSDAASSLRESFKNICPVLNELTDVQVDHLERVLSDMLAWVQLISTRRFYKITRQDGLPKPLRKILGIEEYGCSPHWFDHNEKWRDLDSNEVCYVSHPYGLLSEDFAQFKQLKKHGWNVDITGRSHYYPGTTIRLVISKISQNRLTKDN